MKQPLSTRAPAKINLSLHVLGRRADGYHELESLVAFAGTGDWLSLVPANALSLHLSGPTAALAGPTSDNLVLTAAHHLMKRLPRLSVGTFHLIKRLPVASGIGGGSSDAAAALRLLARLNGLSLSHPSVHEAARATGADVLVCLEARARMMYGTGDELGDPLRLPPMFAVLVNPGVPVATPAVFRALGLERDEVLAAPDNDMPSSPVADFHAALATMRNDLQQASCRLQPVITDVLQTLRQTEGCTLARMSGSGATVFGLFGNCHHAARAARALGTAHPDWWIKPTLLR